MTLQAIKGGLWIPRPQWFNAATAPAYTATTIDAAADRVAAIFQAPLTGNIDRVVISIGAVTTAAALDVRIETVGTANPDPTGTLWNSPTNTTLATTGTPSANTPIEVTLTAAAAVTRGNIVAVVIQANATPISLVINCISMATVGGQYPYGDLNTTGSYANSITTPCIGVRYDTPEWVFLSGPGPVHVLTASAFDDGTDTAATTGSRRGLRFSLPFPARLSGMWAELVATTTADFVVRLRDGSGTALATLATIDANQQTSTFSGQGFMIHFDSDYDLSANTTYFLCVEPTTTNNVTLYEFSTNAAAYMDAFEGGQDFHLAKFVSSAWSTVTTERPWMGLLVTALDDAASAGSGPIFVIAD